jgi:hypothetical protein
MELNLLLEENRKLRERFVRLLRARGLELISVNVEVQKAYPYEPNEPVTSYVLSVREKKNPKTQYRVSIWDSKVFRIDNSSIPWKGTELRPLRTSKRRLPTYP